MRRFSIAAFGAIGLTAAALVLDRLFPPPIDEVAVSVMVEDRTGLPLRAFPVDDGRWRLPADLDDVDPRFIEALLLIEDQRFFAHPGVDALALSRALRDNLLRGRIVSGASTITMQTARLLEPRPRTYAAKMIEIIRAMQIERRLSKREILELYLTLAPYGGNVEGLRTATFAWFGTDADALTDSAIALLLALPQSPEARRPDRRPEAAREARDAMLARLARAGFLERGRARDAATDPVPRTRHLFPGTAWHFAEHVRRGQGDRATIGTTIDPGLQRAAEHLVSNAAGQHGPRVQAAALVIDRKSRAVLASVGSAGRDRPGGWLDLTRARRSPGSTLKPFVYGLAMDEGLVSTRTRLADIPTAFGSYRPENFQRSFNGELTIADALRHSLNVPAVLVLDRIGAARFIGELSGPEIKPDLPRGADGHPGLAVALGGLGLTAEDLASLYAALGDGGTVKPVARTPGAADANLEQPGRQLLSRETSEELLGILRAGPAPEGRMPAGLTTGAPQIAFKTGTSYGFRDAWAVGVDTEHVAVAWIGRADGAPIAGATGRASALPLLHDLLDAASTEARPSRPARSTVRDQGPEQLHQQDTPTIGFPPDGSTIWPKPGGRPFVLSGRGVGSLHWYADGEAVPRDREGNALWQPRGPGFYRFVLTDERGRSAEALVRVAGRDPPAFTPRSE